MFNSRRGSGLGAAMLLAAAAGVLGMATAGTAPVDESTEFKRRQKRSMSALVKAALLRSEVAKHNEAVEERKRQQGKDRATRKAIKKAQKRQAHHG